MDCDEFVPSEIDIDAIASAKSLGEAMRLLAPQLEGLPRRSRGKYGKRKHLTPEEKAELTRRRNRENARSTRMRRKMYIKHLQQVAHRLKMRHDELNSRMQAPPPDGYSRQRAYIIPGWRMRLFSQIVSADFEMTVPTTPYDDGPRQNLVGPHLRRISGAAGLVADCLSLRNVLSDLADKRVVSSSGWGAHNRQGPPRLIFKIDPASIVHVGEKYMCQWSSKIAFVEDLTTLVSVSHTGMASFCFAPDKRIASATLRFDVLAFCQLVDELASEPLSTSSIVGD